MRLSILIPTLNRLTYLREALDSARQQTHSDLEILVSDDGSVDGSVAYLQRVMSEDSRVKLLPQNPHRGIFTNINYLLSHVEGDAFTILGDDDRLRPSYAADLLAPLISDPSIVASFCDHWIIDSRGYRVEAASNAHSRQYGRDTLAQGIAADAVNIALQQSMCIGFSVYRSSVFKRRLFDVLCGPAADWEYVFYAAEQGPLYFVRERLGEYRVHGRTATQNTRVEMGAGIIRTLVSRCFKDETHESARRKLLRQHSRLHAFYASSEMRRDSLDSARRYFRLGGAVLDPTILASIALALLPNPISRRLKSGASRLRRRFGEG